ncbi:MAG: NAD(P)H-dependent oxidoreductase subunit E [Clostridia bacterium]|nr:NAD(P)H-dependent oxidoreductase subunit E [Clostridia bacterium]
MALTQEQKQQYTEELLAYIEELKASGEQGILMPVMQKAQGLFGHLPLDIQVLIADKLDCPVTDVYGVATFYAQFSLTPKGDYIISVCTGTACYVKGAQAVLDEVIKELGINPGETTADGKFTIQDTRCLGCCGLAPVMTINEKVYGKLVPADIKGILADY